MMLYDQITEVYDADDSEGTGSGRNEGKHAFRAETTKLAEVINLFK
jgi:hypothetical protein